MDVHSKQTRSYNMSCIRCRDTKPELIVRSIAHRLGFRFRLNRRDLPGKPDLVFPRHRKVIFVHGCFWHMHQCRFGRVVPKTNADFWNRKRCGNVDRDVRNKSELDSLGWQTLIIWECQTRDAAWLRKVLLAFLS